MGSITFALAEMFSRYDCFCYRLAVRESMRCIIRILNAIISYIYAPIIIFLARNIGILSTIIIRTIFFLRNCNVRLIIFSRNKPSIACTIVTLSISIYSNGNQQLLILPAIEKINHKVNYIFSERKKERENKFPRLY